MKNALKNELESVKAENNWLIRQWKQHPIKMILRILAVVAAVFTALFVGGLATEPLNKIGYSAIKSIVFIAYNKWAGFAFDAIFGILFVVFLIIFVALVEVISDAVLLKRDKHLESKGESSFAEKEIEEEQSDKKYDKIAKAILIAIPIITILFFLGSVYVSTFNSTVFTNDTIIEKSPFNPSGTEYSYSDIAKIEIDNKDDSNLYLDLYMKNGDTVTVDYSGETDSDNEKYIDYPEAFIKDFLNNSRNKNIPITFNCTYKMSPHITSTMNLLLILKKFLRAINKIHSPCCRSTSLNADLHFVQAYCITSFENEKGFYQPGIFATDKLLYCRMR